MGTCRDCDNFVAPDGCRFVIGQISPFGGCHLFEDGFAKVEGRLAKASVAKLDRDTFAYQEDPEGDDACGNCEHFNAEDTRCWLYDRLNHDEPRFFDLDAEVSPESYCTAHTPIGTVGKATGAEVDSAAAEAHPNPSQAQIAAGNYKKGHVRIHGLDISIENAKGSTRRGTGPDGTPWEAELPAHYGYVRRTVGADDEQVDIFIGPNPESAIAFVVDQLDDATGLFDEHKALLGFDTLDQATTAYRAAFSDDKDRTGAVHRLTIGGFKRWLRGGPLDEPIGTQVGKLAKMDDPVDHEFKHPVPVSLPTADSITEARARHFAWSAINDGYSPKDWPAKTIPTDLLVATQDFADKDLVDKHLEAIRAGDTHQPPMTVKLGRFYYVMDGQHRIEAGKLAGEAEIKVKYLPTGVGKAADLPFRRTGTDGLAKAKAAPRGTPRYKVLAPPVIDEALLARAEKRLARKIASVFQSTAREMARLVAPALRKADDEDSRDRFGGPRIMAARDRLRDLLDDPDADPDEIEEIEADLRAYVVDALAAAGVDGFSVLIDPAQAELQTVAEAGAHAGLAAAGDMGVSVQQVNRLALDFARDRAGELVGKTWDEDLGDFVDNPNPAWSITDATRGMIADDVTQAIEEGWSTDRLAEALSGSNYAFSGDRAEMIARTEVNRANNAGNLIGYRASSVVQQKIWLAGNESPDGEGDEACDECEANAEVGPIDLDDVFPSGDDAAPAHPHCRCAVAPVVIDEVTGEETEDDADAEGGDDD